MPASSIAHSNVAGIRLQIEYVEPAKLTPAANRTRVHSQAKIKLLSRSILDHGLLIPIRVNGELQVLGGHALLEAATAVKMPTVPVVKIEHLTREQERLFAIAENKLTEGSSWDVSALRIEFEQIALAEPEIDLGRSGFTIAERDIVIGRHRTDELVDLDDAPPAEEAGLPVSQIGDLYQLGPHRLLCGDATAPASIAAVCGEHRIRSFISDLPYNVPIAGHVSGLGANKHADFVAASGEMSRPQFTRFIANAIGAAKPSLRDGALLYLFMDWRHLGELLEAAADQELGYLNLLVWAKTNAGMGSFYRSAHEMIGLFKHGSGKHINNVELGRHGRSRTNVLHYPGVNTFTKGRAKALELHPTVKPVALIADLILDSSAPGDFILDSFGGSGTTLIAAEKMDRVAGLVELDPRYVDTAIRRWQELTGQQAVLSATGEAFEEVARSRSKEELGNVA